MFKLFLSAAGFFSAVGMGVFIVWQADQRIVSNETLDKLQLPLEQTDYFEQPQTTLQGSGQLQTSTAHAQTELGVTTQDLDSGVDRPLDSHIGSRFNWVIVPAKQENNLQQVSTPEDRRADTELTKEIQRHLRRSGCGAVPVNGKWDDRTQSSLFTFIDNSNASLPIKNGPDAVFLSLLKNYEGKSCGLQCIGPSCHKTQNQAIAATQSQKLLLVAPPKLVQKTNAGKIVSGWRANIENQAKPTAQQSASSTSTAYTIQSDTNQTAEARRIDTTSFGGNRMGLGARLNDSLISPQGAVPQFSQPQTTDLHNVEISNVPPGSASAVASYQVRTPAAASAISSIAAKPRQKPRRPRKRVSKQRQDWKNQAFTPND